MSSSRPLDPTRRASRRDRIRAAARVLAVAVLGGAGVTAPLAAQDGPGWERRAAAVAPRTSVFSSTHAVNLPTAETIGAGELLFEISHRFTRPVSDGSEELWGLDGPVFLRLSLAWAPTDRVMIGVTRSNFQDNLDLGVKARLFEGDGPVPFAIAVAGGRVWNTQDGLAPDGVETSQWHAEAILDLGLGERLQLGIVPGIVTNPLPGNDGEDASTFLGTHARVQFTSQASLIAEWIAAPGRGEVAHDGGAVGLELETGGHFFKLIVGNSFRLNPSQAFVGAEDPFGFSSLRFGFNITRLLAF